MNIYSLKRLLYNKVKEDTCLAKLWHPPERSVMEEQDKKEKRSVSKEEKVIRLLQYLKANTDENHPASIPMITRFFDEHFFPGYFGDKNTRKNMIKELVRVLNTAEDGNLLPREEWIVVYDDFVRDNVTEKEVAHAEHHICNIYYRHPFRKEEVRNILSSIRANQKLSDEERNELLGKVSQVFVSREFFDMPKTPDQRTREAREKRQAESYLKYLMQRKMRNYEDW